MKEQRRISLVIAAGFLTVAVGGGFGLRQPAGGEQPGETFFGQPVPGAEPVKFWPEVLTAEKHPHGQLAFSPDGTGVFWSAMLQDGPEQTIFYSAFDGKTFSRPQVARFAAVSGNGGPSFSADGNRLFFSAELPPGGDSSAAPTAICYVDKNASGWTEPVPIESTIDTRMTKGQVSVASNGNIYFSGRVLTERMPGIYVCRLIDGQYSAPEKLSGPLADVPLLVDPWVDPDERFLLVSFPGREGPPMLTDIGISYHQGDGIWSQPVRLGRSINTPAFERFPSLSRDGRHLFFIRSLSQQFVGDQAHFYWVDTKTLDEFLAGTRPTEQPARQLLGRELEPGQAVIWYLYHSGWAVKTRSHLLIFDYTEPAVPPARRALDAGSVEPAEIAGQKVTVFVSHGHSDHFDPRILEWRAAVKNIRYVWGWEREGTPTDVHFGTERRTVTADGLEVLNIYHEGDGTPESSFLVRVDGLTIFHAGDHGHSRGLENPVFKDNILYLAAQAPHLDLFFTPTFGGEIDAIRALKPRTVFPMHDGGNERQYAKFAEKVKALGLSVEVGAAEKPGAQFLYSQGKLAAFWVNESPNRVQRQAPEEILGYIESMQGSLPSLKRRN